MMKRFNVKYEVDDGIRYWEIIDNKTQNNTSNEKKLCEWLNELAEENQQLHRVIEENEKLIQSTYNELSKLRIIKKNLTVIKARWNWIMESIDYD